MNYFWTTIVTLGIGLGVSAGYAQDREESEADPNRDRTSEKKQDSNSKSNSENEESSEQASEQKKSQGSSSERNQAGGRSDREDEIRLKYDGETNRLSVDVDEEIDFPNEKRREGQKPPIARDGDLELRYDTDTNDMRISGEGTVDADRAVNAMARWWQSWWEEEKTARRSRQQGAESGARHFIREHDDNADGYLSRRELPEKHRSAFVRIDRNDDKYLSRDEVRRFGNELFDQPLPVSSADSANSSSRDQTWSEWWESWWSSDPRGSGSRDQMTRAGATEFIRRYDRNGDDAIMRSEMPDRMYDDFDHLDADGDRRLTMSELEKRAPRLEQGRSSVRERRER